jgi:hypothetical protein
MCRKYLTMGVGKDMLDQGLKQVSHTLTSIEQLHQREFMRHGHLNSPAFFAACKKVRLTETGGFAVGTAGAMLGSSGAVLVSGTVCAVVTMGSAGLAGPVCGIVLVGASGMAGGVLGGKLGESVGEVIYEATSD